MRRCRYALFLLALATLPVASPAQVAPTAEDYARSAKVQERWKQVYDGPVRPHWLADGLGFWYETQTRAGKRFRLVRAADGQRWEATTKEALAEAAFRDAPALARALTEKPEKRQDKPRRDNLLSPDGTLRLTVRDGNLWLEETRKDAPPATQLTFDGAPGAPYEWESARWSPDGRRVAVNRLRFAQEPTITLRTSAPNNAIFPTARTVAYARAGDDVAVRLPALIDIPNRRAIPLDNTGLEKQWFMAAPRWRPDSQAFTLEWTERGFSAVTLWEIDADGVRRARFEERPGTFVNHKTRQLRHLADGLSTLWVTERTGWRQLWRFYADGRAIPLTQGAFVVHDILRVDESAGKVWFTAAGIDPAECPYQRHLCVAALDGSGWRDLTPGDAHHDIALSPDGAVFVDNASRADSPAVSTLRRTADGAIVAELQRQDIADLAPSGWTMPIVFSAKGRDGKTDIWGVLRLPPRFDPKKRYPVLEQIYAGPHGNRFPADFLPVDYFSDIFTELGFVVVRIDGMGTAGRSKAFHDVCYKNLRDAGFPDRILWLKAAAARYPWLDIDRVGIFGWSAGGQNALAALLWHNDFYKAAIALCGCHDNRLDKLWWNEQFMGWPVDHTYAENSNVVNAHRLKGDLFLICGEDDDNVDPSTTLQVVHALIRANKNFEQLFLPNTGHSISGPFVERKMKDFFVRSLLNAAPPPWD